MENLKRLIAKYAAPGPRYTSYPTALDFSKDADKKNLEGLAMPAIPDASLYIHIPFCSNLCRFCGCTTSLGRDSKSADEYLGLVETELSNWREAGMPKRLLRQIHLGGEARIFCRRTRPPASEKSSGNFSTSRTAANFPPSSTLARSRPKRSKPSRKSA